MDRLTHLPPNHIFVFGSNEAGIHGAGAAWDARNFFGARQGKGMGFCGQSYAIPTKNKTIHTLPLTSIRIYIHHFMHFAKHNPQYTFHMTPIGTGLAGIPVSDICHLFQVFNQDTMPENIIWPKEFIDYWDSIGYEGYKSYVWWWRIIKRITNH